MKFWPLQTHIVIGQGVPYPVMLLQIDSICCCYGWKLGLSKHVFLHIENNLNFSFIVDLIT